MIVVKDLKGTNTIFDYNSIGKVVQERSVDNTIWTYYYDHAGRLISKINKDRTKIAYDYDEADNIIKKYYLDLHNQQTDDSIVYSYNGENMRLGMRDKSGLSKTLYDRNGNMVVSTSNNDKDIVKYEYDTNNRLIKMIYPNNIIVRYTYDENGNIKTVTDKDGLKTIYTYDDNDNEVIRTTGLVQTERRYDADNRLIRIKNFHSLSRDLIDEYSYRYDSNNNIIEEIKREPYKKKTKLLDINKTVENDRTIRVTKQNFTYDAENKLTDARVERLGMKGLSEPNVTIYHYEYDANGNRTLVEIKDDGLTLESTVYEYDRLNKMIRSREVTAKGLYIYEYKYDDNGNLISEDRHRIYETQPVFYTNIRRYEYTKDNKLEAVYSGNTLLVAYSYDGDGTITSSLDRDLDFNQNLNINDRSYMNALTNNQRRLINKINPSDTILYEMTEYVLERNQEYSQVLMERDGAGNLSTLYTYGNQRINSESYPNLSGLYTYDGRGSVSAVIGTLGDYRATYWYDGLGNVKCQIHGYGAFGSGKKYYGYNAESYNPVTGNQNLRARQVNIRRQRFLTEDTFLGKKNNPLTLNRYIYANDNPLRYKDPGGNFAPLVAVGVVVGVGVVSGVVTGFATGDWQQGVKVGIATSAAVGVGMALGVGAGALVGKLGMTSTVGTSIISNAVSGLTTSVMRDTIGNVWLGEQNNVGKNAIKSTIGGGAFGGINAGLGGVGASVKGIPNLAKNAGIAGIASAGASVAEDLIGNAAFGESNSLNRNAGVRGIVAGGFSLELNSLGNIMGRPNLIDGYDYYDVASYVASRKYLNTQSINNNVSDISEIVAEYLVLNQNRRLEKSVIEQSNLYNYNLTCNSR